MIMEEIIKGGRSRGHLIKVSSAKPRIRDFYKQPDLWLLVDIYNCPLSPYHLNRNWFKTNILNEKIEDTLVSSIIQNGKYIHWDNAYVDICDMGYLPCNGSPDNGRCPLKGRHGIYHFCPREKRAALYSNALLNVFLSPLHLKVIQGLLGDSIIGEYLICKPLIDITLFRNKGLKRDIHNLFVGAISEAKGLENMRNMFPEGNVTLVGKQTSKSMSAFGKMIGYIPYERMSEIYNRAINFVFLPRWPEPQGRVVVEAALCGCKLICNANVGALSFPFDLTSVNNYEYGVNEVWQKIEGLK
jgi:glycosyltransferase involved in cell wall biosynthesis